MLNKYAAAAIMTFVAADSGIGEYGTGATDAARQDLYWVN